MPGFYLSAARLASVSGKSGMKTLLIELRAKIRACVEADAMEYDGDQGPASLARCNTGIELDDFIMEKGAMLVSAINKVLKTYP